MKKVYCLRVRPDDSADWSAPEYYRTRKSRDSAAALSRIIGGFRTHSYEETPASEAVEFIDFA